MKQARKSIGGPYDCNKEWPEDCFVQCGGGKQGLGLVIDTKNKRVYRTAFFEAFPKQPKTFIRGEGETIEDAEKNAWDKYQAILNCPQHNFERFRSIHGKCKHCALVLTNYFPPENECKVCGMKHVGYTLDNKESFCQKHFIEFIKNPENDLDKICNQYNSTDDDDKDFYSRFYKQKVRIIEILEEYGLNDKDAPDYQQALRIEDEFENNFMSFQSHMCNNVLALSNKNNNSQFSLMNVMMVGRRIDSDIDLVSDLFKVFLMSKDKLPKNDFLKENVAAKILIIAYHVKEEEEEFNKNNKML